MFDPISRHSSNARFAPETGLEPIGGITIDCEVFPLADINEVLVLLVSEEL